MQITYKMDANYAANIVISLVTKSNLNYCIQESPFSLFINLFKTFIKNKSGNVAEVLLVKPLRISMITMNRK